LGLIFEFVQPVLVFVRLDKPNIVILRGFYTNSTQDFLIDHQALGQFIASRLVLPGLRTVLKAKRDDTRSDGATTVLIWIVTGCVSSFSS
jgi:hypothetical protein